MNKQLFTKLLMAMTLVIALFSFSSCIKDPETPSINFNKKVLILNQGNFTEHSASISLYDEESGAIKNRLFESANGASIGATIVSGSIMSESLALLVCNYPDKIEFISPSTGKSITAPISSGLATPRNAIMTNNYLFVSNWDYNHEELPSGLWIFPDSYVAIYDLRTMELVRKVKVGTDAEGMMLYGNRLFVATYEGIRVFDMIGDDLKLSKTIRPEGVTGGAKYMALDKNLNIWASFPSKGVIQIDPSSLSIKTVVEVPVDQMDGFIIGDFKGEKIYTYHTTFDSSYMPVEANIYAVEAATGKVTTVYTGESFSGVGVSPATGRIFTAESSFTSNSVLKVISPEGVLEQSAATGVGTFRYLFF